MEEDWEMLHASDLTLLSSPKSSTGYYNSCDGAIRSDYFAVDPERSGGEEGGLVDPALSPKRLGGTKEESGVGDHELLSKNLDGFWSDESSDGQISVPGSEKEGPADAEELEMEVGCEEIEARGKDFGVEDQNSQEEEVDSKAAEVDWKYGVEEESSNGHELLLDSHKEEIGDQTDSITESSDSQRFMPVGKEVEVDFDGIALGQPNSSGLDGVEDAGVGRIGQAEGIEMGYENSNESGAGKSVEMEGTAVGNGGPVNIHTGGGEKKGVVWWKLPLELLKFCAFRVRPVWSISVAAAILGFMMLGRRLHRLYGMKHKSQSIPLKIAIDDKKASQIKVRVAKLNEAFSVVRRVPIIRSSIPVGGTTPWPMLPSS